MKERVGFIGMGIMGSAMASNLLRAGYELGIYNRNQKKCLDLAEQGARVKDSPARLARKNKLIVMMVTGPEAIDDIAFGANGLAQELSSEHVLVNMSSVSPAYTRDLADRLSKYGTVLIDAPVSGSKKPAQDGKLLILAGGDKKVVKSLEPIFLSMGKKVIYCGSLGQGSMMKMAINLLLGVMMEGLAEMVNFGLKGDLSINDLLDVVLSGPLGCGLYALKEPMLRGWEFPTQFPLKHMAKDLKFVVDTAYELNVCVPSAHTVLQVFKAAWSRGWGEEDFAAVIKGLDLGSKP